MNLAGCRNALCRESFGSRAEPRARSLTTRRAVASPLFCRFWAHFCTRHRAAACPNDQDGIRFCHTCANATSLLAGCHTLRSEPLHARLGRISPLYGFRRPTASRRNPRAHRHLPSATAGHRGRGRRCKDPRTTFAPGPRAAGSRQRSCGLESCAKNDSKGHGQAFNP